jgi:maltose alpha-D-glucosyltransferase/alpha-amylase
MQWSPDRNAGFSAANPQQLYLPLNIDPAYHYEHVNVETQQTNPNSLLSWTKRLIALRKQYKAFGRGTLEFLQTSNHRVAAFVRRYEEETILVIANLSRFAQPVTLNLTEFHELTPVEMFGRTDFPCITDSPYTLTLGPSSFYWFSMERRHARQEIATDTNLPASKHELPLVAVSSFESAWQGESRETIARVLARFAQTQSWYLGEQRFIRTSKISDVIALTPSRYYLVLLQITFTEGDPQTYNIPCSLQPEANSCAFIRIKAASDTKVLCEAAGDPSCTAVFLDLISRRKRITGEKGSFGGQHNRWFKRAIVGASGQLEVKPTPPGRRNTTVRYDEKFLLKLLRSVEPGEHPGVSLSRLLTETYSFPHTAPFAGTLDYQLGSSVSTLGVLHGYVENNGEVWSLALDHLKDLYERMRRGHEKVPPRSKRIASGKVFSIDQALIPHDPNREDLLGDFRNQIEQIGTTLAEMHGLLARDSANPAIAPEAYNDYYRQSLYHGMVRLFSRRSEFLRQHLSEMTEQVQEDVSAILGKEEEILSRFRLIYELRIQALRTRYHGQMGLEHILRTDSGFTFIDFEGDPQLHLTERSIKRTPLRDVASLLHSLAHALQVSRIREITGARHSSLDDTQLLNIGIEWYVQAVDTLQRGYWRVAEQGSFLPPTHEQQQALLNVHLLERSLLDLKAFFYRQRDLFPVPLRIMLHLLGRS